MPNDFRGDPNDLKAYARWLHTIEMEETGQRPDELYFNDGYICPHCDNQDITQIRDVTPSGSGKNFWCQKCSAGWLSIANAPGRHYWRGEIHDWPCHHVGEIDPLLSRLLQEE